MSTVVLTVNQLAAEDEPEAIRRTIKSVREIIKIKSVREIIRIIVDMGF